MPSASTLVSDIGEYATPFFNEFYTIIKAPLGIIFAVGCAGLLIGLFLKFAHTSKQ